MSRIIAAIDNSPAARPVLAMAKAVAPFFAADVEAVHVVQNGDQTVQLEAAQAGVSVVRLEGGPAERIVASVATPTLSRRSSGRTVTRRPGTLAMCCSPSRRPPTSP